MPWFSESFHTKKYLIEQNIYCTPPFNLHKHTQTAPEAFDPSAAGRRVFGTSNPTKEDGDLSRLCLNFSLSKPWLDDDCPYDIQ